MLTQEFCEFLEYEISKAFENANSGSTKGFWCDGVLLPIFEHQYTKKSINDSRKVTMTAFIGVSGQDRYELTLHFGPKALSKYARGLTLLECVPNPEQDDWIEIETESKTISVQLY